MNLILFSAFMIGFNDADIDGISLRAQGRLHLREGRLAEAVVAFRTAVERQPWDADARDDLNALRVYLGTPSPSITWWQRVGPLDQALLILLGCPLVWIGGTGFWIKRSKGFFLILATGILLWCTAILALNRHMPQSFVVVKRDRVPMRKGNSDFYDPVERGLLRAGTELTRIGKRGGWVSVQTHEGIFGWINEDDVLIGGDTIKESAWHFD